MSENIVIPKKSGRGGARKGAGRKAISSRPVLENGWYVYLLSEAPSAGFLKIGVAHRPYARLMQGQTCNPRTLSFAALWALDGSDAYAAIEKGLHRALRPFHVRGEWFEVAVCDVERHLREQVTALGLEARRVL
jgi:hypothetical protein